MSDLKDAFDFYEQTYGQGVISIDHFQNILKNNGFYRMDKKSIDHELNKLYPDFPKCTAVDFSFTKYVVAAHWNRGGGS